MLAVFLLALHFFAHKFVFGFVKLPFGCIIGHHYLFVDSGVLKNHFFVDIVFLIDFILL